MSKTSAAAQSGSVPALTTSASGEAFIAAHEGVVLKAYPDPGSGGAPWTIGIGHTSAAGLPKVTKGLTITRDQAFEMLKHDLVSYEKAVLAVVHVALNQNEFDALVSLCFNIGPDSFATSTLVKKLNAGDRAAAAKAFLSWTKAAGHVMAGLVRRRQDERSLFLLSAKVLPISDAASASNDNGEATGVMLVRGSPFPDAIRALQQDLQTLGYNIGSAAPDGDFGGWTEKAAMAFQLEHGLTGDGKVGPATRSAIAAAIKLKRGTVAIAAYPLPGQEITAIAA